MTSWPLPRVVSGGGVPVYMRHRDRLQPLASVALALALAGCATKGDIRTLQAELGDEVRALAARQDSLLAELRFLNSSTQDTLRTQADQLFDFRGEITRQVQAITQTLARLEALTGENQRGIASVRDQLANIRRLPTGPSAPPPSTDSAQTAPTNPETVGGTGGNAEQLWNIAREQHQRGSFGTAQRAYEQFLEDYPTHALAPDAHFYLADILTQLDRPDDALEAFQEILTLFPTAAKVPDALYRIAVLQSEAGDQDDARATLERIVNTYPDATIAMLARDMLEELR
ncbi:MAG: tol-pal system protein YbgF [Gemmatimonadetes bacterium]|nr:tol-pal system protein YbgF [Gemmatimonadota bacterium]